ncbi:MAG: molybdate ABC transporter substrate-binding protein [Deltaproteobacteria bacterium]|nr:molybdate ABC transporter substrate-binding protein [Deltaproteobacteria bacterium]
MKIRQQIAVTGLVLLAQLALVAACGKATNDNSAPAKSTDERDTSKAIHIHAAAGTRLATTDICDLFEKKSGVEVIRNFASSGTLARQIASGAVADMFLSANRQWIDFLIDNRIIARDAVHIVAGNALVLIAPKGKSVSAVDFSPEFDIASLTSHVAVGDPAYVPVGKYTDEAFKKLGWTDRLTGRLVLARDVSSVLHYVELGECELGVVYASEALASKKVQVVATVPAHLHRPIVFYVAPLNASAANADVQELNQMFLGEGKAVFTKYGFTLLDN